jgi:hypothetical protein
MPQRRCTDIHHSGFPEKPKVSWGGLLIHHFSLKKSAYADFFFATLIPMSAMATVYSNISPKDIPLTAREWIVTMICRRG